MERSPINSHRPGAPSPLLETVVLSFALTGLFYYCYFLLAPWIWRQNIPFKPADITAWVLTATTEHDGIEIYALYLLMFLNIAGALTLSGLVARFAGQRARSGTLALATLACLAFCAAVGFIPPMNSLADATPWSALWQTLIIATLTALLTALLWFCQKRSVWLGWLLAALLLVPPCFFAVSAFGWRDYTYIFAPALRLLDGAAPWDIYFQYDLLPSLLAAGWMKLGLDLQDFRILGQGSYYLALLAVFVLSSKLFLRKELPCLLLAALVLGRIYASPYDATLVFQVTPVRLDLWIPLLLVVYRLGPYHWLVGLVCGLLLVLIKNFGIIYSLAYIQLLVTLWGFGYFSAERRDPLFGSLLEHARRCLLPVAIMGVFGIASFLLFRNVEYGNFAGYYQKIGIGFIQVAKNSFYWYVPAIFSTTLILLFRLRNSLPAGYLNAGILLTYCAIGNSIYFFGRSHEHNILNIAIVLLFLFFFLLDLMTRYLGETASESLSAVSSFLHRYGALIASVALIAAIIVSYSENISKKGYIQLANAESGKLTYTTFTIPDAFQGFIGRIREITDNSKKVYFVDEADFAFYYYGGYEQSGYCNPFLTWIFTKDLNRYLQNLLDNGYYLVCSPNLKYMLDGLKYNSHTLVGDTIVVGKLAKQAAKP